MKSYGWGLESEGLSWKMEPQETNISISITPESSGAAATGAAGSNGDGAVDIWRDSLVRYLGYSNELGESFRPIVPRLVLPSYAVAFGYVFGDTFDKVAKTQQLAIAQGASEKKRKAMANNAMVDTLLWQTLASVAIPGFTINRIVALSTIVAEKTLLESPVLRRWAPTAIGLGVIPFIIHPIDHFVDSLMDNTTRKWAAEYLSKQDE